MTFDMLKDVPVNEERRIIRDKWKDVLDLVKNEYNISDTSFSTWLSDLYVGSVCGGKVHLCSDNNNINSNMTHIKMKYGVLISTVFEDIFGKAYEIVFDTKNDCSGAYCNTGDVHKEEIHLESHNVLTGGGILLNIGQTLFVDGSKDLSSVIMFGKGGCVYEITLRKPDKCYLLGEYLYMIEVLAQGPAGVFSQSGKISFWDLADQKYELCITSESKKLHTIMINSEKPQIMKIEWTYFSQHNK